jgi:hypothetical protein
VIGVISKAEQRDVVEEFFELFKTPWEFHMPGRAYEVVLATTDDVLEVDTRLLLLYGAEPRNVDKLGDIVIRSKHHGGTLNYESVALPIYGELATFEKNRKWKPYIEMPCGIVSLRTTTANGTATIRFGFDIIQEIKFLFTIGQPADWAHVPTLDLHIEMLRNFILAEGIPLLEIPPVPSGYTFAACLTHDIDFIGIRQHFLDHTMFGFLYRSTIGAVRNVLRGRLSLSRFFDALRSAASLPFVYLGWAKDFWSPFDWYLRVEKNLPATYYLIPFKHTIGDHVPASRASRRATAYDVSDLRDWIPILQKEGCELGVHGIDAWHSVEKGRAELGRIATVTGKNKVGIRMHWLMQNADTISVLEKAGYEYDSTAGYNETTGYRNGTSQVFRPLGARTLLELPVHVQDGTLFYPDRLDLSESQADKRCKDLIANNREFGGVFTVIWHDRSHGAERFWGDFYVGLVQTLKSSKVWFATGAQAVHWFRKRRQVRFERLETGEGVRVAPHCDGGMDAPSMHLRVYRPLDSTNRTKPSREAAFSLEDSPWNAKESVEYDAMLNHLPNRQTSFS